MFIFRIEGIKMPCFAQKHAIKHKATGQLCLDFFTFRTFSRKDAKNAKFILFFLFLTFLAAWCEIFFLAKGLFSREDAKYAKVFCCFFLSGLSGLA